MKNLLSEKNSLRLLFFGVMLFIAGLIMFIWKESFFTDEPVNSEKFSQFGDFIGGIIGSIWSLAGVILFYVALTEQKKDISINRETLVTQVETLNQQIKEFKLQRIELEETRLVFKEQSLTLKSQRFENTFFQLLNLHHELIDKLSFHGDGFNSPLQLEKRELLTKAFKDLNRDIVYENTTHRTETDSGLVVSEINTSLSKEEAEEKLEKAYRHFYIETYKQVFSHYFRNIYHIFKYIYTSNLILKKEKQFYASIVRAQLSSDELFLILYNSLIKGLGYPNFLFLIKHFDIMQNFDLGLIDKYKYHLEIYIDKIEKVKCEF